jgi:predicted ATPase
MTPFDKFPLGNEPRQLELFSPETPDIYAYLGMRERMGRSSSSALLSRAMEGMFARVGSDERGRLTHVFDMLGFTPSLAIVYRLENSSTIHALAEGEDLDNIVNERRGSFMSGRLERLARSGQAALDELRDAARESLALERNRYVTVELDLREASLAAFAVHSNLLMLRRAGLGRLYGVEAKRKNGTVIDLKEASSGELSMAITFMSLAANLTDSALVLIDEPETNLHPEWQARYIDVLLRTFKEFRGCHYVLATHSPLILSDAPPNATVASLSDSDLQDGTEVSGRPVDYLLVKAFDVASGANYYVQEELVKALRLAADGASKGEEFQTSVRELAELRSLINDSPGVVELIGDLEKIASKSRPE